MLPALICDPELQTQNQGSLTDCEVSCSPLTFILLCFKLFLSHGCPSLSASGLTVWVSGRCLLSALWAAAFRPRGELWQNCVACAFSVKYQTLSTPTNMILGNLLSEVCTLSGLCGSLWTMSWTRFGTLKSASLQVKCETFGFRLWL